MFDNLKKWDGKDASGSYQYPLDQVKQWGMMIDNIGTIYYTAYDGELRVWCTASRLTAHLHRVSILTAHLHRLEQIKASQ